MGYHPTFSVATLGCKVNQYDSWQLARALKKRGFRQVPFGSPADVIIVNSCTVTHVAEAKSRKILSRARRLSPDGVIVFTGCAAEMLKRRGVQLEQVDIMAGNTEKEEIPDRIVALLRQRQNTLAPQGSDGPPYGDLTSMEPEDSVHERSRAFLKVQEGCDKFCTFCIIPFTRGMPQSKPLPQVLDEAKELVEDLGFSEIVLTGVCLSLWGKEFGMKLTDLIERLHEIEGLKRIRLSSLDPRDLDEPFARTCATLPKVCHHFHISLQSGDDAILSAMGRGYTSAEFLRLVGIFRHFMPDAAFTTDVMVGFPGETDAHFENTVRFVREVGFMHLHVFRFSPRPGTKAAEMKGMVKPEVAEARAHRLIAIGKDLWSAFARRFLGETMEVLVERCQPLKDERGPEAFEVSGLTGNYLRVHWISERPIPIGTLVPLRLMEIDAEKKTVWGEACSSQGCDKIGTGILS